MLFFLPLANIVRKFIVFIPCFEADAVTIEAMSRTTLTAQATLRS